MSEKKSKPGYLYSIFSMSCPRCRRGKMFTYPNPFASLKLSRMLDMPDRCPVCRQQYDMEKGFWYGTGYVSYALTVAFSVSTFVAWWVLIGVSARDNRILWWLLMNCVLLVVLQPWLMRLSRVIWLYFFVTYDENYEQTEPQKFDS